MLACAGPSRPHTCVSGSPGRGGSDGRRSPLWAAATGPGLLRSLGSKNPSGYWLFGGQLTATQGRGVGSAWAPACAVCVCAGAYRVSWRSRWGGGCICGLDCGPVPPMRWRRLPNFRRCSCIVEPGHQGLAWSTPLSMAHVSSRFSMQHLPATQRAASPSPGAALLQAFAGRSRQSRPVRKSHYHVFLGGLDQGQAPLKTLLLMLRQT